MTSMTRRLSPLPVAVASACAVLFAPAARATTITILNLDSAGEGFNDPTVVAPVTGNPATTRGAQRLAVFQAAADYWETVVDSPVTIKVEAQMNPLAPCDASSGLLGSAGPKGVNANFAGNPVVSTWYAAAEANSLAGIDLSANNEIVAQFNTKVDGDATCFTSAEWWYGIGAPAPAGKFDFFRTVLHEIGHGLGILTFVDVATGVKCCGATPLNDAYMRNLEDHSLALTWNFLTDGQRANSAKDTNDLHWVGLKALALGSTASAGKDATGHLNMYAPATLAVGSSVSHWTNGVSPNELMEPFLNANARNFLTLGLLRDLGWKVKLVHEDDFEQGDTGAWLVVP